MLREYTEELVKGLVDKPHFVNVTEKVGTKTILLRIDAAKEDLGCIIGKKGNIINAIRTLVEAVAGKMGKRVVVELVE